MNTLDVYCFVWFCTGRRYEEICEITPYAKNLSEYEFNEMCKLSIPTNSALDELKGFIKLAVEYGRIDNAKYLIKYHLFELGTQYNYEIINYSCTVLTDQFLDELIEYCKLYDSVDAIRCILHVKSELIEIDDVETTFVEIIESKDAHKMFLYALVFSRYNQLYSNCLFVLSRRMGFDKESTFNFSNVTYDEVLDNCITSKRECEKLKKELNIATERIKQLLLEINN